MRTMSTLACLLLASCTHDITAYDRIDSVATSGDVDVLYVFDNTTGASDYSTMASQLTTLQSKLASVDGQLPNLHVGVVTTDLGLAGTKDVPASSVGCAGMGGKLVKFGAGITDAYLSDARGPNNTRVTNFASNDLAAELGKLTNPAAADVPAGCSGISQPLEAMKLALDPANNPGFIRPGAKLVVIFLSNQDDCSLTHASLFDVTNSNLGKLPFRCTAQGVACDDDVATPGMHQNCHPREDPTYVASVADYAAFLGAYKPDPNDVAVFTVGGPTSKFEVDAGGNLVSSCSSAIGGAKPSVRLGALAASFQGSVIDGCTQAGAYDAIAKPVVAPHSCFSNFGSDDGDDCDVLQIVGTTETMLDKCTDASTTACWHTEACTTGGTAGIAIDLRGSTSDATARYEATCFLP